MRIKFGNHIDAVKRVSYNEGSQLLLVTTIYQNMIYTIDCRSASKASDLYRHLLTEGWIDVSYLEYVEARA